MICRYCCLCCAVVQPGHLGVRETLECQTRRILALLALMSSLMRRGELLLFDESSCLWESHGAFSPNLKSDGFDLTHKGTPRTAICQGQKSKFPLGLWAGLPGALQRAAVLSQWALYGATANSLLGFESASFPGYLHTSLEFADIIN